MHLGLLSHGHLAFDPLKPVILRGGPNEDASTLFAGNLVLTLSKPTKISNVTVTLRGQVVTYWPEGIGARGTKLTAEKSLGEQTLQILTSNDDTSVLLLPAGTHRFSFAFVIPNSTVATIEDTFGRVRHTIEAEVQRPGIVMLSSWRITKNVMILRTYMSNSLLTNNSLTTLSRTFEKHMAFGDIEIVIEAAAFSSGDLFYIRMIVQPHVKHTRIEHMEVNVTETRKYSVPEMRAWRHDSTTYSMPFAGSVRLAEFGEVDNTTEQLKPIFCDNPTSTDSKTVNKKQGIELMHDFAHRLAFFAPTCQQNIRHTTYIREIQFKHHIEINLTFSYVTEEGNRQFFNNLHSSTTDDIVNMTEIADQVADIPGSATASTTSSITPAIEDLNLHSPVMASGTLTPPPAAYVQGHSRNAIDSPPAFENKNSVGLISPDMSNGSYSRSVRNSSISQPTAGAVASDPPLITLRTNTDRTSNSSASNSSRDPHLQSRFSFQQPNQQSRQSQQHLPQEHLQTYHNTSSWSDLLLRLNKTKIEQDASNSHRRKETITLDTPITVFDCRLKEDYGRLPSYFELGVKPSVQQQQALNANNKKKSKLYYSQNNNSGHRQQQLSAATMDKPDSRPHPFLCDCYYAFCKEMEMASQALYLSTENAPAMPLLDRIPSIPPPDYAA
ncbi:hypothetical protein BDF20DRAFT_844958 [Mycotypha africana]|uniref:uncharacterized protein n=1 Tax=Mycotypha africana TaxID=64632 RepID=UPI002300B9F8|nr:uncharacterized protein BDF20DRAFT_844958 [Mycotypha africana]KAI8991492.1 hypothetical protein BDF20DRAFT_844958 [Mycotypha africana]